MASHVYCTLLMSDSYLPGATVLAHSLRDSGTTKELAVLVTLDTLLPSTVEELKRIYDYVIPVERIATPHFGNLHLLGRYELRFAFTKIALWQQTQFDKIVYVDADVVALRAPDELFDLDVPFAAAPDVGWPDCFNSGLMVLKPSESEYLGLRKFASQGTSFDGADQGLLNEYFENRPWHRLSFTYNCTPSATYQYEPAYRKYGSSISMVHFIGKDKPWIQGRQELQSNPSGVYKELLGKWWAVYDRHYVIPASSAYGQIDPRVRTVKQYVRGEDTQSVFGWAASGLPVQGSESTANAELGFAAPTFSAPVYEAPQYQPVERPDLEEQAASSVAPDVETPQQSTEQPMSDPGEPSENLSHGVTQPVSTTQQRKFSAPRMEWDATRSAPPSTSKPEAQSFPSARYEMSHDPGLFHAPSAYPEPPKDMWYKVPEIKPTVTEAPNPIFPWEQTQRPAPTRVFLEPERDSGDHWALGVDLPQTLGARNSGSEPKSKTDSLGSSSEPLHSPNATNSSAAFMPAPTWNHFTRANAWDDDQSIDRYVRALKINQIRKGPIQVLHTSGETSTGSKARPIAGAPTGGSTTPTGRRGSLILTDFPTVDERPSLPVTPAPVRRSTFWGGETEGGEVSGQLPPAEGVPDQAQWVCPRCGYTCPPPIPGHASSSTASNVPTIPTARAVALPVHAPLPPAATAGSPQTARKLSVYESSFDFFEKPRKRQSSVAEAAGLPSYLSSISTLRRSSPTLTRARPPSLTAGLDFFKKDPLQRLEELRRSSIAAASHQQVGSAEASAQELPRRELPKSAAPILQPKSSEEKPVPWRNLEEMFSGEHTQELIAEGASDASRGIDPSQQSGASESSVASRRSNFTESSNSLQTSNLSSSRQNSASGAAESAVRQIPEAATPDSPQPQHPDLSSFTQRSSKELTEKLVRDVETRMQETMSTMATQSGHRRRPRAQTGFMKQKPRLSLQEQDEDDDEYEGKEESGAAARLERHEEATEYGEYDIA